MCDPKITEGYHEDNVTGVSIYTLHAHNKPSQSYVRNELLFFLSTGYCEHCSRVVLTLRAAEGYLNPGIRQLPS